MIQRQNPIMLSVQEDVRKLKVLARLSLRHATPRKIRNFLTAEAEMLLRRSRLAGLPYFIKVEPTNNCNLRCPLCPQVTGHCQVRGASAPVFGTLPFELYTKLIDDLRDVLFSVLLYGQGEPFLSGDIFRMIRYARERNIGTMISTNLNISRDGFAEEVVQSGLDFIEVSLDGADQTAYETFRVGGDFALVRDNLARIIAARRRLGLRAPLVEWKFIVMRHNEHQIDDARRMAREIGVDYLTFTPVANIDPSRKDLIERWVSTIPRYRRYDVGAGLDLRAERARKTCSWLYRSASVNCDGSISPCCYYPNFPQARFGDLREETFRAVWNNTRFMSARAICNRRLLAQVGEQAGICYLCRRSERA
ncbi:MAG: radical SAM protein [bacterium]|nr:radical SAM protein [bacterium]